MRSQPRRRFADSIRFLPYFSQDDPNLTSGTLSGTTNVESTIPDSILVSPNSLEGHSILPNTQVDDNNNNENRVKEFELSKEGAPHSDSIAIRRPQSVAFATMPLLPRSDSDSGSNHHLSSSVTSASLSMLILRGREQESPSCV